MTYVNESNVSTAWLAAVAALDREPKREAFHTVVAIADPVAEVAAIRAEVDQILVTRGKQSVETVANTIFPAALARASHDHEQLVQRYVGLYPKLKRFPKNDRGVYFHRLIQYPAKDGPFDQIGAVIERIETERNTRGPKRARYETTIGVPDDLTVSTPIHVPGTDTNPIGFPCLSHCSFQLDNAQGQVHLLATYRSQFLVERGYGNYLGLGRLLAHVADQTGLQTGRLTVVAGLAHLEPPVTPVRDIIDRFTEELAR